MPLQMSIFEDIKNYRPKWMPPSQHISREEIRTLPHSELNDDVLMDLVCREFGASAYAMMRSALMRTTGHIYETQIDTLFANMLVNGRMPPHIRKYLKDVLLGDEIFIRDTQDAAKEGERIF